jgi:pimeloyl-ACP methyl ester carboxylesterase
LIGHDWGASIAYAAAAAYPDRIRSLTALAMPHPAALAITTAKDFGQLLRSWHIHYFKYKGRAEKALPRKDFAFLERLWRNWSPEWVIPASDLQAMKATFSQPGVLNAALEYFRQAYDPEHPRAKETMELYSTVIQVPTLGLMGGADGYISSEVFERSMPLALFFGGLRRRRIDGAGHFLHLEAPDLVNDAIISHLRNIDIAVAGQEVSRYLFR